MSVCTFLASDFPLPAVRPMKDYPLVINVDTGTIYDGGADDNFYLLPFSDVDRYTEKNYGVQLQWHPTEGRAKQIVSYIKTALQNVDSVEIWHVWLTDYYEFDGRPVVHRRNISIQDLSWQDILDLDAAEIWNVPDRQYPLRPSFYCWRICK